MGEDRRLDRIETPKKKKQIKLLNVLEIWGRKRLENEGIAGGRE